MMRPRSKPLPEVLAPAGGPECLDAALLYGADAVYLADTSFGMRAAAQNFDRNGIKAAIEQVHRAGKKVYIACNILPRNADIDLLPDYLRYLDELAPDGLIVADLGVIALVQKWAPSIPLHVSTQMGVVNHHTARMLFEMGAKRVVLARELSLREIAEIRDKTPPELELETFVHGAMCMSVSGRCVLSNYLTGRDANHGACTQPCRWRYDVVEPHRPDKPMTVEETEDGTYIFNAHDLNMLPYIAAMVDAGISSFKIEGRAKAAYYTAVITNAYRAAVDGYRAANYAPDYVPEDWIIAEADKVSHRPYSTGFYFGMPHQNTASGGYIRSFAVAGVVEGYQNGRLLVEQRNRFFVGDTLDVLVPGQKPFYLPVEHLYDGEGREVSSAPHAAMKLQIPFSHPLPPGSFLRVVCD